jgi:hypothetical protein
VRAHRLRAPDVCASIRGRNRRAGRR